MLFTTRFGETWTHIRTAHWAYQLLWAIAVLLLLIVLVQRLFWSTSRAPATALVTQDVLTTTAEQSKTATDKITNQQADINEGRAKLNELKARVDKVDADIKQLGEKLNFDPSLLDSIKKDIKRLNDMPASIPLSELEGINKRLAALELLEKSLAEYKTATDAKLAAMGDRVTAAEQKLAKTPAPPPADERIAMSAPERPKYKVAQTDNPCTLSFTVFSNRLGRCVPK